MDYELVFDNKTINHITKAVYNPDFGAREIRRYITDYIEDIIAEKVIYSPNVKSFSITVEKNELIIK
jgi:ATP-dependent Clp protease ATP-binding subunit ClpA